MTGKPLVAGIITGVGSWISVIGGTIAQAALDPASASWIDLIMAKSSSTLGVVTVLGFVVYWLTKDREKLQLAHREEVRELKVEHKEEISQMKKEIVELQRYVLKRKSGMDPAQITASFHPEKQ